MRTSAEQRRQAEQRIRAAADALLRGDIPPDGKCDITTLARQAGVSRAALYRSYPHLKEEFERRLAAVHASGAAPDPRDAQITRLKAHNDELRQKLADRDSALRDLEQFKVTALSRLAAQHDEISPAPPAGDPRESRQRPQPYPPPPRRNHPRQPGDTMTTTSLATALRACASGIYALEAGIGLLIANGTFLHRDDFTSRFVLTGTSARTRIRMAAIDWDAVATALAAGDLPCSGGERRILKLAASLAGGIPVDLRNAVTGLDQHNTRRLVTAIRHASGPTPSQRNRSPLK